MSFLRSLLYQAGRRIASDPRVREKAKQAFEEEVKPRAKQAAAKAKPRYETAREDIKRMADEPENRENRAKFAGRATRRFIDGMTGKLDKE
jgi:hypothetical protein